MFSSKKEFAKAMIDGRVFKGGGGETFYARWLHGHLRFYVTHRDEKTWEMDGSWGFYDQVTEALPWYERIPEQGVLCWVWDDQIPDARVVLIRKYEPDGRYPYNGTWGNAKPLTLDEAKRLIVKE